MILKGTQRGGARDLAQHLMKDENDHVDVHEIRGFVADDLHGAFQEAYAISRGTRCQQFLYSLSLNPPPEENVSTAEFEAAIDRAEEKLGLQGQPRAIVFHEKEGPGGMRRHAHAVWSRIDVAEMKAVQMSFDHEKLNGLSRELFIEYGWRMPRGLADRSRSDPRNFTLEEWQQAKRSKKDPRDIKAAIQDAWAISDSKGSFAHALEERGYMLARGDRRGFVAVDLAGEVYAIPRMTGKRTKAVRERLGEPDGLPSVEDAQAQQDQRMRVALDRMDADAAAEEKARKEEHERRRKVLVAQQRAERATLKTAQAARSLEETKIRQARFRHGLKGLWDKLRGEHRRIEAINTREAEASKKRDRSERDKLAKTQLSQRRQIQIFRHRERQELKEHQRVLSRERETLRPPPMAHTPTAPIRAGPER